MNLAFFILFPLCFVSCIPLPQTEIIPERDDFGCHVSGSRKLYISWRSKELDPAKQPNLDLSSSWAISPTGSKYLFKGIERKDYTIEQSYWKDITLVLIDNENPDKPIKWYDGSWLLHLGFTKNNPRPVIETKINITTFHYNPVLHGPPN